jgi:coproporphyrinogen III oxidase-like Fe-S oxidoreductase
MLTATEEIRKPMAPPPGIADAATLSRLAGPGARARRNKNLLVYFHVPFCSSKCHFCDWVVGYNKADLVNTGELRERYVDAICTQIEAYTPMIRDLGYKVTNIYWGGGTPTRLTPDQMARIFDALAGHIDLRHVVEHTAECSPETVTAAHLEVLRARGLNRASAGAQSFDPQILRRMGRAHSSDQVGKVVDLFHGAGLTNFNLDLITGFPGQTAASSFESIQRAIDAGVPHVSLYMFREFSDGLISVKQVQSGHAVQRSEMDRASSYAEAKALLEANGYEEYIVGYFAKGRQNYFDSEDYYFSLRGDYFGFGAGAASILGRWVLKSGEAGRYGDSHVRDFIQNPLAMIAGPASTMPDMLYTDGYFKAFATREGIQFDQWYDQFGFDFDTFRRRRPGIAEWFTEREKTGAVFTETAKGISLSPETWIDTMIWRR